MYPIYPGLTIYVAGPPCQGFSEAGSRGKLHDPRSRLYLQSVWAMQVARPQIAIIENPLKLTTALDGYLISKIIHLISSSGYKVYPVRANTKHLGLPQNRERMYIVALRLDAHACPFFRPSSPH